jgi:hypothetical protein
VRQASWLAPERASGPIQRQADDLPPARLELVVVLRRGSRRGRRRDDDDTALGLAFEDTKAVETIAARLNGRRGEGGMNSYSRGSACGSYYLDRAGNVDPGAVELVLDLEWQ